jgi:hypothetical protein
MLRDGFSDPIESYLTEGGINGFVEKEEVVDGGVVEVEVGSFVGSSPEIQG